MIRRCEDGTMTMDTWLAKVHFVIHCNRLQHIAALLRYVD